MKVTKLLDGTPINKKEFLTWIKGLRSGKYSQTIGVLNNSAGFCCLGVACDLIIPPEKLHKDPVFIVGVIPGAQAGSPEWLKRIDRDVMVRNRMLGFSMYHDSLLCSSLTSVNDLGLYSFEDIANILEDIYVEGIYEGSYLDPVKITSHRVSGVL